MMTNDELIEYIENLTWDDVKDLPHVNCRVYLNQELEIKDEELENSSYLYLNLFSEPCENGEDRYFGSDTEFKTKSFMQTDYLGTPVTKVEEYNQAIADPNKEHRFICLRIDDDEANILTAEEDILDGVDAKGTEKFFNASNISGGRFKTLAKQEGLFENITSIIEKANNGEECEFETGEDTVENLRDMPRAQPRQFDLDISHVNDIANDIMNDPKVLNTIRHTILMEDYFAPGKHKRGGNTHTIEACVKPGVKKYVKRIKYILIPKNLWNSCSENTLRDILRWDNKKEEKISRKETPIKEILESCLDLMEDFKIKNHTHGRVKRRAFALGATGSDWKNIRPKLKELIAAKDSKSELPSGMEFMHYTETKLKQIAKDGTNDDHETHPLSTVYSGGRFNGFDFYIRWLSDPKNEKRTLYTPFYHGEWGHKKYADAWPDKQKDLIPLIERLFEVYGKKGHFTWDVLPRWQPKQNKIHDKKAA